MHPDFIFFDFSLPDQLSCVDWACDSNFPGNITCIRMPIISLTD